MVKSFNIDGYHITASSKNDVKTLVQIIKGRSIAGDIKDEKTIIIQFSDDETIIIDLTGRDATVYSRHGMSITKIGDIRESQSSGDNIISAALNNLDTSREESTKMRKAMKSVKHFQKEEELNVNLEEFRSTVPLSHAPLYQSLIEKITGKNMVYEADMYRLINASITIKPENWPAIIRWFTETVLHSDSNSTLMQKRKAFVTAVIRMGEEDCSVSNTVKKAAENDEQFWDKYSQDSGQ